MRKTSRFIRFQYQTTAICLKEKSIVNLKQKVTYWKDIQEALENNTPLQDLKRKKESFFLQKHHSSSKLFVKTPHFDPNTVAQALYHMMTSKADKFPRSTLMKILLIVKKTSHHLMKKPSTRTRLMLRSQKG
jgi:hypothetical protein